MQGGPNKKQNRKFLENGYEIYGKHLPKQICIGGIFRKISVCALGAPMFTHRVQVIAHIIKDQQWSTKQQYISFPKQCRQGQLYMRKYMQCLCTNFSSINNSSTKW
jgi:hypothetical protein